MTNRNFIELADTIKSTLANFCQTQNPRFNREHWIAYINGSCGPNGGKRK